MNKYILGMSLSLCNLIQADPPSFINTITIDQHTVSYAVHEQFHATYLRENFYVTYQDDIDLSLLDYTIITMPLIMNTIGMIWVSNNDYSIEAMDKDLYTSLETVKEVFRRFYPSTQFNGNLIPKKLVDNSHRKFTQSGIALPFSHGLDSLCTSLRLRTTPQLLITARGYPDTPIGLWNKNWEYTQMLMSKFAQIHGHTTTFFTSNFHDFFNWPVLCRLSPEIDNWRVCMVEGLGWMGLAAPILMSKGYTTFVLPANNDWTTPHPGADCPLIVENIKFAGITNISAGFELSRNAKNKIIAQICNEHNLEKPKCLICEKLRKDRQNCCKCLKCVLSILAFIILEEDPSVYGFDCDIIEFCNYVQNKFIDEHVYEDYSADWFKYCQQEARLQLPKLTAELQPFFSWFIDINFDARTVGSAQIVLDYNDFTDLYKKIPKEALERKKRNRRRIKPCSKNS